VGLIQRPRTNIKGAHRFLRRPGAIAIAFLCLAAATIAGTHAGSTLVISRPVDDPDAIIVLASHESDRFPRAVQLAHQYPEAELWLSVPVRVTRHNCERCAERVAWLGQLGVDPERITLLPLRVTNTRDEARAAAAYATGHPIDRLVVVTSPYHTRRALATFHHLFAAAGGHAEIGIEVADSHAHPARWWLRRVDRNYVAYEWAAIVYYGVRFGVFAAGPGL
jgi:uncharacterized SAM-binding protein YcdF (DUF218 family)